MLPLGATVTERKNHRQMKGLGRVSVQLYLQKRAAPGLASSLPSPGFIHEYLSPGQLVKMLFTVPTTPGGGEICISKKLSRGGGAPAGRGPHSTTEGLDKISFFFNTLCNCREPLRRPVWIATSCPTSQNFRDARRAVCELTGRPWE